MQQGGAPRRGRPRPRLRRRRLIVEGEHPGPPGRSDVTGLDAYRGYNAALRTAFPDQQWLLDDLVAEGDKAVLVWTLRGTHRGELSGVAPTGKDVTVTGISAYRIADGKVAEIWVQSDTLGLLQQIGASPTAGPAGS